MPSANKMTTPIAVDLPEIQGRYAELDRYTVGFESYPEHVDPAPLFRGLPDDRCQCPHWGVVQSGQITFRWATHEETYGAGDVVVENAWVIEMKLAPCRSRISTILEKSTSERVSRSIL